MGNLAYNTVKKRGKDALSSQYTSLFDIPALDIDSNPVPQLGNLLQGKKCILVVNVATK